MRWLRDWIYWRCGREAELADAFNAGYRLGQGARLEALRTEREQLRRAVTHAELDLAWDAYCLRARDDRRSTRH